MEDMAQENKLLPIFDFIIAVTDKQTKYFRKLFFHNLFFNMPFEGMELLAMYVRHRFIL